MILPRKFPGRTGDKLEKPQSGSSVCRMRFELGTPNQVTGFEFEILPTFTSGCEDMYSNRSLPTFCRKILHPF
jgi:hypothetical protein